MANSRNKPRHSAHNAHDNYSLSERYYAEDLEREVDKPSTLPVSRPNDRFEREADQAANAAVSGQSAPKLSAVSGSDMVQRQTEPQTEEEKVGLPNGQGIQMKSNSPDAPNNAPQAVQQQIQATAGKGQPLEEGLKEEMEGSFGHDFSNVRIHQGDAPDDMNKKLNARAFTIGQDVYFSDNAYRPQQKAGKHLIAHELAHTVQQGSQQQAIQRAPKPGEYTRGNSIEYLRDIKELLPGILDTDVWNNYTVPMALIMQTEEFKSLMNPKLTWQKEYDLNYDEAVFICREMLATIVGNSTTAGRSINWGSEARTYVEAAIKNTASSWEISNYGTATVGGGSTVSALTGTFLAAYNTLVSDLTAASSVSDCEPIVEKYAKAIWAMSKSATDDRQLYYARIRGKEALMSNPLLTANGKALQSMRQYQDLLETVSRGHDEVTFTGDPKTKKRILMSGFDPYGGGGGRTEASQNTSGVVAQRLDGTDLPYTNSGGTAATAEIQSVTVPVKWSEFDKGMINDIFEQYVDPSNNVAAIVTLSLHGGDVIDLEMHYSGYRGGGDENDGVGTDTLFWTDRSEEGTFSDNFVEGMSDRVLNDYDAKTTSGSRDYVYVAQQILNRIQATMPYLNYSGLPYPTADRSLASSDPLAILVTNRGDVEWFIEFDFIPALSTVAKGTQQTTLPNPVNADPANQEFYTTPFAMTNVTTGAGVRQDGGYSYYSGNSAISTTGNTVATAAQNPGAAAAGSGGDYLSNEIPYRISVMRQQFEAGSKGIDAVPNIHLHIPPVGGPNYPDIATLQAAVQKIVAELMQEL